MLIPGDVKNKLQNWMFGCDICQDVCPWNRFSKPTTEAAFSPIPEILNLTTKEWENITEDTFKKNIQTLAFKTQQIQRHSTKP